MKNPAALLPLCLAALLTSHLVAAPEGTLILEDDFDREESSPELEEVGNGWGTNSKSRAKGVKQVDLADGAMHITMAEVADHGVSVHHEAAFKDVTIQMRFRLREGDDLGINIADMNEKSVHAGHICMAKIQPKRVEITDMKTGRMKLENREAKLAGTLSDEAKKDIATKSKAFPVDLKTEEWHLLEVRIDGETMQVSIDEEKVGEFTSPGIGHPTKSRLRLAVNHQAWVDDVKIWSR